MKNYVNIAILVVLIAAQSMCVMASTANGEGEARIINGDVQTARIKALSRAKIDAVQNAIGTNIESRLIVKNFKLFDEVIKNNVNGKITSFRVLDEKRNGNSYYISLRANIESLKALKANFIQNKAVFISMPVEGNFIKNRYDNYLAKSIAKNLIDRKIDVVSKEPSLISKAANINEAMNTVNSMLAGSLLIGNIKIDELGNDSGYSNQIESVSATVTYKLVSKIGNKNSVILVGSYSSRGVGVNKANAVTFAINNLAKKYSNVIAGNIHSSLNRNNVKTIRVHLDTENPEMIKDLNSKISFISWVVSTKIDGNDLFVDYGENPLYLQIFINDMRDYKVERFNNEEIFVSN